jgi:phosphoribosyl-AMP cyclohydrolase
MWEKDHRATVPASVVGKTDLRKNSISVLFWLRKRGQWWVKGEDGEDL